MPEDSISFRSARASLAILGRGHACSAARADMYRTAGPAVPMIGRFAGRNRAGHRRLDEGVGLTGPSCGRSRCALQETRHQNVVLGDSGPKSRFGRRFPHTETSPYVRNAAISRHFERDPIPYALETDWPVGAAGFEPLHLRIRSAAVDHLETFFGNEERHDKLQLRCVSSNPAAPG